MRDRKASQAVTTSTFHYTAGEPPMKGSMKGTLHKPWSDLASVIFAKLNREIPF